MNKKTKILSGVIIIIFSLLILCFPKISKEGITRGLMISSNVIIPSLFPFMVCVSMIIKYGLSIKNTLFNKVIYKLFGHTFDMFLTFLLSLIGGYPIGAKLVNDLYNSNLIDKKTADIMLVYCVNAGPAFIISVIGGTLASEAIGMVIFISHILSSVILALVFANKLKKSTKPMNNKINKPSLFSEMFVQSVGDACESIVKICSFIVLFSAIIAYFDYFSHNMTIITNVSLFLEVTSAVYKTKNVYFISFLLGFSGISIWCQIFALSKSRKINYRMFVFGRILHGALSALITKILLKFLKVKVATFSNGTVLKNDYLYSDVTLLISIVIMLVVFLIFIYTKNSGKFINDVI